MITQATWDRIEAAIAAAPLVEGEVPLSEIHYRPDSRAEFEELVEEKRKHIVLFEHHAAGLRGATREMRINASHYLPALRASRSLALLALRVMDEVDAELPQLDAVGALMVATMLLAGFTVPDAEAAELAVRDAVDAGTLREDALYLAAPLPASLAEARTELESQSRYAASLVDSLYGNGRTPDLCSQWSDMDRLNRAELLAARAEVVVAALSARELAVTA